jgi:hypothetical protein
MSKLKKLNNFKSNNDHRNTQDSPENHVVVKTNTKRKAMDRPDEHAYGITQKVNKKMKDIGPNEEKESITHSKQIGAKDAEQPTTIEQEKETRSRRKRVRIMKKEDNARAQIPTIEIPEDPTTDIKLEKDPKRNKSEHRERDPPD